jgi:hypothetical protein
LLALGSAAALAANTPAGLRYPITRGTSRSVVDLSAMIGRALPAGTDTSGYKAAMTAATRAYAQYLAAHGFNPLPLQSTWREAELAGAVGVPSLAALWAAWKLDIAYQWVTTRLFIVCGALVSAAAIVGMAVGLARVAALGTCAVLVAAPVSVTYSRVLSVAANYDAAQPFGFVNIVNNYPFGGIDINAPTITKGVPYGIKNHNVRARLVCVVAYLSLPLPPRAYLPHCVASSLFLPADRLCHLLRGGCVGAAVLRILFGVAEPDRRRERRRVLGRRPALLRRDVDCAGAAVGRRRDGEVPGRGAGHRDDGLQRRLHSGFQNGARQRQWQL